MLVVNCTLLIRKALYADFYWSLTGAFSFSGAKVDILHDIHKHFRHFSLIFQTFRDFSRLFPLFFYFNRIIIPFRALFYAQKELSKSHEMVLFATDILPKLLSNAKLKFIEKHELLQICNLRVSVRLHNRIHCRRIDLPFSVFILVFRHLAHIQIQKL